MIYTTDEQYSSESSENENTEDLETLLPSTSQPEITDKGMHTHVNAFKLCISKFLMFLRT